MKPFMNRRGIGARMRHVLLGCLLALSVTPAHAAMASTSAFRPPAVPLVTHDPYFSIWSPADKLTDADTIHWTGKPHRLTSLVRIDGKAFRLMGKEPANVPALLQTGLEVLPTRTIYTFEGEGLQLTLTFMTPLLADDLMIGSRPVTYVTWELLSVDGRDRAVAIYLEAGPEIAVNEPRQVVGWSRADQPGLGVLRMGTASQPVLQQRGDDLRIDWGYLYVAIPTMENSAAAFAAPGPARAAFVAKGGLVTDDHSAVLPAATSAAPAAIATFDMAAVGAVRGRCWLMLAYDDEFSLKYFRKNLRPYWRRNGDDAAALLRKAATDRRSLYRRCEQFDAELMADLRQVGGEKYAQLCALAYRQTFAGNKIVADANGQPLMFPKENSSNGCIGTVDVLFPQAPFFLVFSPALTQAMLVPILDYAASPRWPYGYAPHDLGTYPHATGQVYGMGGADGDRMPVEESGNMLIMLSALARLEGNADLAKPYWPMLTKWADYLVKEGLDPQNQLCSADMFGPLPHAANLALKAIIGIGGYAQLCERAGRPDEAKKYLAIARDYSARWQELARDDGRTRLAYHLPGTWGMKHNLIWDRVLGLGLFPEAVGDQEIAWYLKVQNKYGLPVDNRTDTSLIDWALWSIAPARNAADFQALLDPIWRYVNETPSRVPLSDWYVTTDAAQKGFQARPVVGGLFIKMLAEARTWAKWAGRGANTRGPWAPIPISPPLKSIVPTAETAPVNWRYTFAKPPDDWFTPGFDDSAWKEGPAGFGTQGTPGAVIRTEWNTTQIWLRRAFTLPDRPLKNPRLRLIYDEDPEIYFNGVLAAKLSGWVTSYEEADSQPAALATLKPGRNVLAVRARQTYGGQSIDVGMVEDSETRSEQGRWSPEQVWTWYRQRPWIVGFNYVPSTACNTTEFWSAETFDERTIDRELGWGAGLGFNSCRVFMQYLVWKHDPAGLKQRLDRFLLLADRHGLSTTLVLFDDCAFGDPPQTEPYLGRQRDPIPGMILPSWTPSPGLSIVTNQAAWPDLESYIRDIVGAFAQDRRVLMWDLYNEPGNSGLNNQSLPLVEATFAWARAAHPSQPLTMGPWGAPPEISQRQLELSDLTSFHFYGDGEALQNQIANYQKRQRPVINTEWMARLQGSRWDTDLPRFKRAGMGCYSWGLVNGRTQCQFAWYHQRGTAEPKVWFHDLFHANGRPYDPAEHEAIRKITASKILDWSAVDGPEARR